MKDEIRLGDFWCSQVLDRLADYRDGLLPESERAGVDTHLAGCRRCAEFGGAYAALIDAIRARLGAPTPLPPEVAARLDARIARETKR